jgi:hypothetical protein
VFYRALYSYPRADPNNRVKCELNLNYQSVALDELVVLQDKLLLQETQTTINSMTSVNGKINTWGTHDYLHVKLSIFFQLLTLIKKYQSRGIMTPEIKNISICPTLFFSIFITSPSARNCSELN